MTLLEILIGAGLVVGVGVCFLVYLDCVRRDLPLTSRLVRALACGGGCIGGFLVPYALSRELQYLYIQALKPRPIAATPREWLSVCLAIGFVIGIVLVSVYVTGSRLERREPV